MSSALRCDDASQGQSTPDHAAPFFMRRQLSIGDCHVYAYRSRFIPNKLLSLFESITWPILATQAARQAAISQVRIDIGA
jgi:DNA helicase-2/ATP-dependent DNA helicase PcrA